MTPIPRIALTILAAAVIVGCTAPTHQRASGEVTELAPYTALQGVDQHIPTREISDLPRRIAAEGIKLLGEGDLDGASVLFNRALKLTPANSNLQLLNALTYHIQGIRDDNSKLDLAEEGYKLAIQFDPTNWIAHYQLGLLFMDRKDFKLAQGRFAEALLYRSDNPELLYNMVCASYYNRDPATAAATLGQLEQLEPDSPRTLRAAVMVKAALGRADEARGYYSRYSDMEDDREDVAGLFGRLQDWEHFHHRHAGDAGASPRSDGGMLKVANTKSNDKEASASKSASPSPAGKSVPGAPDMVIVDVVIVRSEEETRTRKGVNLLDGLSLQFGGYRASFGDYDTDFNNSPAWSQEFNDSESDRTVITSAINIPALHYSLNIFNSTNERNEVLARPTLVAQNGMESKFFSGINIRAAAVGEGDSKSKPLLIEDDIGVTLKVTPKVIDSEKVQIFISASRTFLRTPSDDVDFQYRIETSKTDVEANVQMNFGETLILSGLSEKETENIRDGVPGLQDVPVVQYLFSKQNTLDFQKSVLILLTPRKPAYIYQDTASLPPERRSEVLNELQARFSDWFKPYPNWASVFHHLQSNILYREFRTGDVTLERWESQKYLKNRLKAIVDFLYF
jgi:general secretion pathway protein D